MKNLETIKALFVMMEVSGISLDDLNAYANNQSVPQVSSSACKLPLEVLYDGGYRSFYFETGKTPIAIICGDFGVAFEDAPQEMNYYSAKAFCEKYSLGGTKWQLPNYEAGHLKALYENKDSINEVLTSFGKKRLNEDWYWASERSYGNSWGIRFSDGYVYDRNKNGNRYVRPVLIF